MATQYASTQSAGFKNHIQNVAIVGAGGQCGKHIVKELLATGKHTVTALTRMDSPNELAAGVHVKHIDYDDQASIVTALKGQDVLVITMNTMAPPEQQTKLLQAAATAKIEWILPNQWGIDQADASLSSDVMFSSKTDKYQREIIELGVSSYINVVCGFWYEYSLGCGPATYGFDFRNREVTFFDDGETRINTSTWPQTGLATARLLSLKVLPDDENDKSPCLSSYRNKYVYISSFRVNQKEMFASVQRVTGTTEKDWKVKYEPSKERHANGKTAMMQGDRPGFARMLYARNFYQNGCGDFETTRGLQNDVLALPKEDMDEATKLAVEFNKVSPFEK